MMNLLIVDDNEQNLYMLQVLLEGHNYKVILARNGAEALKIARSAPPDMIISDILMPVMDGFSLCIEWMKDKQLLEIPFIIYTATYTDSKDEEFALSLGAARFIIKPKEPDVFVEIIQEVIANRKSDKMTAPHAPVIEEPEILRQYSERLVKKLEDKMLELEQSNQRLSTLYQVSAGLTLLRPLDELVSYALSTAVEVMDYTNASYFAFDAKKKKFHLLQAVGFSGEVLETFQYKLIFTLGEERGLVGLVGQTREPLIIADTTRDPRWVKLDETTQSALLVPVVHEDCLLGVMNFLNTETDAFSDEDVRNLLTLANNVAIAIHNVNLFDDAQRRLNRLSALRRIDQTITGSLDLDISLKAIVDQVVEQLEVDAAALLLYQKELQTLVFSAGTGFLTDALQHTNLQLGQGHAGEAALERRRLFISALDYKETGFLRSPRFKEEGFISYYGVPLVTKGELVGVLEIFHRSQLDPDQEWVDFMETLAGQAAIAIDSVSLFNDLQRSNLDLVLAYDATIEGWAKALELRDMETEGHSRRVVDLTMLMAHEMRIDKKELVHIRRGALLHDIGKMGVPDQILQKPGPLNDQEWEIMREHPGLAIKMLKGIEFLNPALDIPHYHHESWDGTGYPQGLKGEEIPLAARIFAIVDVWDALRSDRPYRKAWSNEKALAHIKEQSGKHFDPQLVMAFMDIIESNR